MTSKFRDHYLSFRESKRKKLIRGLLTVTLLDDDSGDDDDDLVVPLLAEYYRLNYAIVPDTVQRRHHLNTESFPVEGSWRGTFGFKKPDLYKLLRLLEIPDKIRLENGSVFTGEELLLLCLYRYKSLDELDKACLVLGRDHTQLSRALQWFNSFIIDRWGHKLTNNLAYWERHFSRFADAIRKKVIEKSSNTLYYAPDNFFIFAFIDCNVNHISRPGAGPGNQGQRDPDNIQEAFYNGWKRFHGLKWSALELPCGLCGFLYGPNSFRRHDLDVFNESEINDKVAEVQAGNDKQYFMYGDRIFVFQSHVRRAHMGDDYDLTLLEIQENRIMAKVRIAVEWDFGVTSKLFKFTQYWRNIQVLKHENHRMYYFVATLLRNLHACLYPSTTSQYFNCPPPSLEDYLL